jgi:hypothetical protein
MVFQMIWKFSGMGFQRLSLSMQNNTLPTQPIYQISYEWEAYSMYTVRHAVTLKWLPIVFVCLIQSQRTAKVRARNNGQSPVNVRLKKACDRLNFCHVFLKICSIYLAGPHVRPLNSHYFEPCKVRYSYSNLM